MNKKLLFPLSLILAIMLYFSVLEPTTVNADEGEPTTLTVITSGYKWIDITPDGVWDLANEPPLPGWAIELFEVTTDSLVSIDYDITDGNGYYEFAGLLPDKTYAVCERLELNYIQTFPDDLTPDPDGEQIFDCTILDQNYGPYGYQFTAMPGGEYLMNNFANAEPLGCTYSEGYWKTHSIYGPASKPDDGWYTPIGPYAPGADGPDADLLGSGMTWYETFRSPVKAGNAWYILAHQWMAAYLNYYNGASSGGVDVVQWLSEGADLLDHYDGDGSDDPLIPKDSADHDWAINLADWLEKYNSGYWGPGSCDNEY